MNKQLKKVPLVDDVQCKFDVTVKSQGKLMFLKNSGPWMENL